MTELPNPNDRKISCKKDLVFTNGERPLHWDVYRPRQGASPRPAALLFHGGAWEVGNKTDLAQAARHFAECGFVALCVEYRLTGEAAWPAQLIDARAAIRAARAQAAELGVDPQCLFLVGFSAGAHLALLAASGANQTGHSDESHAGISEDVAGVAAYFPPARLSDGDAKRLGLTEDSSIAEASPTTHAAKLPPTIIFCGDEDVITPHRLSIELFETIRQAGIESDLRLYGRQIHEFVRLPNMLHTTIRDAVAFFDRTALSRESYEREFEQLREWWKQIFSAHTPH
jgi:acetyl esterase/lipase